MSRKLPAKSDTNRKRLSIVRSSVSLGSLPADTVAITRERPFQNSSERLEAGIVVRFEGRLIKPKRHVLSSTTPRWLSEGLDKRIGWRHGRGTTQGIETLPFSNETAFTACDSVSRIFGLMQYTKNVAGTTTFVIQRASGMIRLATCLA